MLRSGWLLAGWLVHQWWLAAVECIWAGSVECAMDRQLQRGPLGKRLELEMLAARHHPCNCRRRSTSAAGAAAAGRFGKWAACLARARRRRLSWRRQQRWRLGSRLPWTLARRRRVSFRVGARGGERLLQHHRFARWSSSLGGEGSAVCLLNRCPHAACLQLACMRLSWAVPLPTLPADGQVLVDHGVVDPLVSKASAALLRCCLWREGVFFLPSLLCKLSLCTRWSARQGGLGRLAAQRPAANTASRRLCLCGRAI